MIKRHKKLSDDKPTGYCFWCGKKLHTSKHKYCNDRHRQEYYNRNHSISFTSWIINTQGGKCNICGYGCSLEMKVHHIIPLYDGGELFNPENVILLCHDHHIEAHRLYRLLKKILKYLDITFGK